MARKPAISMKHVVDPAAWTADELKKDQGWVYNLSETDIAELNFFVNNLDLSSITGLGIFKLKFIFLLLILNLIN